MSDTRFNEPFQLTSVISLLFQILATGAMLYWSATWKAKRKTAAARLS